MQIWFDHFSLSCILQSDPPSKVFDKNSLASNNGSVLGFGCYGTTYRMKNKLGDGIFAVKKINLIKSKKAGELREDEILKEARLLQMLDHKHIIRYYTQWGEW